MPESVTDRFSKKHEYMFFMVKNEKYYFDLDIIKDSTITQDTNVRDRDTTKLNNTPGRSKMGGLKENNYSTAELYNRIKEGALTKNNYYSLELMDEYIPKPRL